MPMTPIAVMLADAVLDHHVNFCVPHASRPPIIDQCVITYGDLCRSAGVPGLEHGVGKFLGEVAEWCAAHRWPPINSLAVNAESRMPGDSYDLAQGCNLLMWPDEASNCIVFTGYPAAAP
jgi:hypothetical protein